jgi:UDP-glucose 4-epimerase
VPRKKGLLAISGADGFIGGAFKRRALESGHDIRILSRAPDDSASGCETRFFDLLDPSSFGPELLDGCDAVAHFASYIPKDQGDLSEAQNCWRANALGTMYLMQAAEAAGVKNFIQSGAGNAYSPEAEAATESHQMMPIRAPYYLSSKIVQEVFANSWAKSSKMRIVTLKPSSVYGPGQRQGPFTRMALSLLDGKKITVQQGGSFAADFVHVDDVVEAAFRVWDEDWEGAINVGSGTRTTILQAVKHLVEETGADWGRDVDLEPAPEKSDVGFPGLDVRSLRLLGIHPRLVAAGIADLVNSLRCET